MRANGPLEYKSIEALRSSVVKPQDSDIVMVMTADGLVRELYNYEPNSTEEDDGINIIALYNFPGRFVSLNPEKESFFPLVSGYQTLEYLEPMTTGRVIKYTYEGGAVRYRYIANDKSEDSFFKQFENGIFTGKTATKKIIL